jgi:hypothetical protein
VGTDHTFEFHDLHVSEWAPVTDVLAELPTRPALQPPSPLTGLLSSFFKPGSKVNLTATVDTNIPPVSKDSFGVDPLAQRLLAQTKDSATEELAFLRPAVPELKRLVQALRSLEITLPQDQPAQPERVSKHGLAIDVQFIGPVSNPFSEFLPALLGISV